MRPGTILMLLLVSIPLEAQTPAEEIAAGIAASLARDPQAAFTHFEAALRLEPTNYEANWRAAQALIDVGKQTPDSVKSRARDSLYARAEVFARSAVMADSSDADGHFVLAQAIGRASLTKSKKERVRRAGEIRSEALRAIQLNPNHDGAYHVMGRWNAEIMRLSGLQRFFARNFLGGRIFSSASWDSAIVYLEKSVALKPENIYHHLDLALVYVDRKRYGDARTHLGLIGTLPVVDVMDPTYQRDAERRLQQIANRR